VVAAGIYWLDNDTILVSANKGPKPQTSEEIRAEENWLYLWRLGEKPTPLGADPHAATRGYYCAARRVVTYQQEIVDSKMGTISRTRLVGTPGREMRMVPVVKGLPEGGANNPLSIEKTDCEIYSDPAMVGKDYVTDSEHRFYIDFGRNQDLAAVHAVPDAPMVLMRADRSDRVELPISNALAGSGSTHFHTFDGFFYLWNANLGTSPINHFAVWRETNCWPIWRVDPSTAKTERFCIPFGPWSGATHGGEATTLQLAPTKAGVFFATNPVRAQEDHGFYRFDNGIVSQILPGYVWSPTISPNGCRVAFIYIPNDEAFRPSSSVSSSIVVIDVCSQRPDARLPAN
jgi:hypothetical protein